MSDPILCPSCKNPINQHTLQGMRLTLDTWCTYRPQDIAAALKSERDRLREALTAIRALSMLPVNGEESMSDDPMTLLSEIADFARAALDKDAKG